MDAQTEDAIAYLINHTAVTPMTYREGKRHYDSVKRVANALSQMEARADRAENLVVLYETD